MRLSELAFHMFYAANRLHGAENSGMQRAGHVPPQDYSPVADIEDEAAAIADLMTQAGSDPGEENGILDFLVTKLCPEIREESRNPMPHSPSPVASTPNTDSREMKELIPKQRAPALARAGIEKVHRQRPEAKSHGRAQCCFGFILV